LTEAATAIFESATPTETATPSPNPTPINEAESVLLFTDDFDRNSSAWANIGFAPPYIVPSGKGYSLQVSPLNPFVELFNHYPYDVAVQASIRIFSGSAQVRVRQNTGNYYAAVLGADGLLALYRGDTLIQNVSVPFNTIQWYTLRLSAFGNVVRVRLNEVEYITFVDEAPLPSGSVAFTSDGLTTSMYLVDTFQLWGAGDVSANLAAASALSSYDARENISAFGLAAMSAGSSSIAYEHEVNANTDIYVIDPANPSAKFRVTTHPAADLQPALSPDGTKLVYVADRSGDSFTEIYVLDGSNYTTQNVAIGFSPVWSPDGQKIAYVGNDGKIYVINANGSNIQQISTTINGIIDIAWSAGNKIAYAFFAGYYGLYTVDMNAGGYPNQNIRDLPANPARFSYWLELGDWSGDGRLAFYASTVTSSNAIVIYNDLNGTFEQRNLSAPAYSARWSPDNSQIGFVYTLDGGLRGIYTLNLSDSAFGFITGEGSYRLDWSLAFSPPPPTATPTPLFLPTVTPQPPPILSDYNIYVIDQNGNQYTQAESIIYQGSSKIGRALLTKSSIDSNVDIYGVMTFRRVMVADASYLFSDTSDPVIAFVFYPQRPTINCQTYNVGGNPANILNIPAEVRNAIAFNSAYSGRTHQAVIGCSTGVVLSEYTVVHELGHVFDGMSTGEQLTARVQDTVNRGMEIMDTAYFSAQPYPIAKEGTDGKTYVVMGSVNLDGVGPAWIRGDRGWGSSTPLSDTQLTNFQQHYLPTPPYPNLLEARRETAADLFLNWVYRTIDPNGRPPSSIAPGNWNGFLNQSWSANDPRWGACNTTAGCIDYSFPGDARFEWIDDRMIEFFANRW